MVRWIWEMPQWKTQFTWDILRAGGDDLKRWVKLTLSWHSSKHVTSSFSPGSINYLGNTGLGSSMCWCKGASWGEGAFPLQSSDTRGCATPRKKIKLKGKTLGWEQLSQHQAMGRGSAAKELWFAVALSRLLADIALYCGDSCKMQWLLTTTAIKNNWDGTQLSPVGLQHWHNGGENAGALKHHECFPLLPHQDVTRNGGGGAQSKSQEHFASK